MPPVSVEMLTVSSWENLERSSENSRLRSPKSMAGSVLSILTYVRFLLETTAPRLQPTRPPVMFCPKMAPAASHERMTPVAAF